LPGYTPGVGFLGSSRPSLGFILVVKMMFVTKRQRMAGWQTILILIKILSGDK
jgi:hypothetical protein